MAGPGRPTKRERKDEAKKRRLEEMRRRQRRARMRKVYTYGVLAAIIAAVLGGIFITRAGNASKREEAAKLAARAGCEPPKAFPIEGRDHVSPPQSVNYKTDPPTSGAHYAAQQPPSPTATGVHTNPVPNESVVHNLEHGHIAISYRPGDVGVPLLAAMERVVKANPQHVLMAPRPSNRTAPLAFTAWGVKQSCPEPNENVDDVLEAFVKRFKNLGPEQVPGSPVFQTQYASPSPAASPAGSPPSTPRSSPRPTGQSSPPASPRNTGTAAPATPG